jgi:hypothetical protein
VDEKYPPPPELTKTHKTLQRQLNYYGFNKIDKSGIWQHPQFHKDHPEWTKLIRRRVNADNIHDVVEELSEEVTRLKAMVEGLMLQQNLMVPL